MKHPFSSQVRAAFVAALVLSTVENANAAELESMGKAIGSILGVGGARKPFKYGAAKAPAPTKDLAATGDSQLTGPKDFMVFYAKGADGKADRYAFVQNWIWQKQCKHGWVIGVDAKTSKVTEARFTDMQCPHAEPIRKPSFHAQFKGKGPADGPKLVDQVNVQANATGSSKLAARAVKQSIELAGQYKGKF